ncbi:MAG: hypothetical protein ACK4GW_05680 [Pseudorhodobacter sp.]
MTQRKPFDLSGDVPKIRARLREDETADYLTRLLWGALDYPAYGYGLHHAAILAGRLGLPAVSAIEFGVAGGNGLLALEAHAARIEAYTGVRIEVYGFDTGCGMPPPRDHRDMPYRFREGNYRMDAAALRARLTRAELVLGDVAETAAGFAEARHPAPIGFLAFDLDYHSSTMAAFGLFEAGHATFLPRCQIYFDNIIGHEISSYNRFVGELAAIGDFNAAHADMKIAPGMALHRFAINLPWYRQIYLLHRFTHPLYASYISGAGPESLALEGGADPGEGQPDTG